MLGVVNRLYRMPLSELSFDIATAATLSPPRIHRTPLLLSRLCVMHAYGGDHARKVGQHTLYAWAGSKQERQRNHS